MMQKAHFAATQATKATFSLIGALLAIRAGLGVIDIVRLVLRH